MKTNANSTASPEPSTRAADLAATDKDFERMMQMLTGFFVTQIAGAVATYSIADHLAKAPATAEQIAAIEGIDSAATFRFLRACASLGLVTCDDSLTFSATPLLGTLRASVPGSLHSLAIAGTGPLVALGSILGRDPHRPVADRSGARRGPLGLLCATAPRSCSFLSDSELNATESPKLFATTEEVP